MSSHYFHVRAVSLAIVGLVALTGCGGSDDEATDSSSDSSGASASSPASTNGPRQGLGGDQMQAIQTCLEAAGLSDAFPTDVPSGMPTDMPSDMPTDMPSEMPTDIPSGMPTDGMPSGGPGGAGGALNDPEVQAALEACGISLPSAPAS